jgi:hypothetical protein
MEPLPLSGGAECQREAVGAPAVSYFIAFAVTSVNSSGRAATSSTGRGTDVSGMGAQEVRKSYQQQALVPPAAAPRWH